MKKKIMILFLFAFFLTSCSNVKNLSYESIIDTLKIENNKTNTYRVGYKYFLPRSVQVDSYTSYNEVLSTDKNIYYLYVDMVSYYNKKISNYQISPNAFYSKSIQYDDKYGYIEINKKENNKYLIEIMYNYAKIEVMVEEDEIKSSCLYSLSILKSITYNDSVIENMLGNDILNYTDSEYNIFNTRSSDSNYLNYDNEYKEETEEKIDTDLLN